MAILLVGLFKAQEKHTSLYEVIPLSNIFQPIIHIHLSDLFRIRTKLYILFRKFTYYLVFKLFKQPTLFYKQKKKYPNAKFDGPPHPIPTTQN